MRLFQNKKSLLKAFLVSIILMSAGFLLIAGILGVFQNKAEDKSKEYICKGSVILREKTYTEINDPITGKLKLGSVATPLLCQTTEKYLPKDKKASPEDIQKEFADLIASCYNMFGEGVIEDVFKQGDGFSNNCFICNTVSLRETSNFKSQDEIKTTQFIKYLFETPYIVSSESDDCRFDGGFCTASTNVGDCDEYIDADETYLLIDKKNNACKKIGKNSCCYTDYGCLNNGGKCSTSNPDIDSYRQYDKWSCPSNMNCYIENNNYYSYGEYVQRFGGKGKISLLADLRPGETYAISFGSPTDTCSWCTNVALGGGSGIAIGMLFLGPPGWALLAAGAVAGTVTYAIIKGASELGADAYRTYIREREFPTVYLTTLAEIQEENLCSIVN